MLRLADALIHLRVPAATKARWVRESRAAGMRLTDWIVARIDGQKGKTMIQYTIRPSVLTVDTRAAAEPAIVTGKQVKYRDWETSEIS